MSDPPAHSLLKLLGIACAALLALATAALPSAAMAATTICSSQTGTNGGYYYQMYTSGTGSACITLNSATSYSTSWSGAGDFVAGVGWSTGSAQNVSYSASFSPSGDAYLSLYGWTTSPLVEYYITDDWSGYDPSSGATYMGSVNADGGTYDLYEDQRVNEPSIEGTATFEQYWAVRTSSVTSDTIDTSTIFSAWASHGMDLGTFNYQILATEGFNGGSGSSSVTLGSGGSSGGGGGGSGGGGSGSGCTATLSAGSSGSDWYNLNVAVAGSTSWTVTMDLVAPAVVYSTTGVNATWPSEYVMTATPGSGGNNWSVTISPNGQWTWPSVSCRTG
ncbi:MAG TPA: glycoside hydrolase family 11 protein [Trebonia sp.]|jgi:endo-1,4-beta-xylanase|nr:glycoside hydrolase family 11 protein [Trebonia sp.]